MSLHPKPTTIDEYIACSRPESQPILQQIRRTIHDAAPNAEETISYAMPAFRLNGILVYFAAFKKHIGLYPPIKTDATLKKAVAPYTGPKGNLQFPLDQPIPYDLIEKLVRLRVKQTTSKSLTTNP